MIPRWTPSELEQAVAGGGPLLVDLRADWCLQCDPQERVLERVVPDYQDRVQVGSVDVGAHPELVDAHGVRTLPAFLLFVDGKHRATLSGFRRAPELRGLLADLLQPA